MISTSTQKKILVRPHLDWKTQVAYHLQELFFDRICSGTVFSSKIQFVLTQLILDYGYHSVLPPTHLRLYRFVEEEAYVEPTTRSIQMWPIPGGMVLVDFRLESPQALQVEQEFMQENSDTVCTSHLCNGVNIIYEPCDQFHIQMDEQKCCQLLGDNWISPHKQRFYFEEGSVLEIGAAQYGLDRSYKKQVRWASPLVQDNRAPTSMFVVSRMKLSREDFPNHQEPLIQRREEHDVLILNTQPSQESMYRMFYGNLYSGKMRLLDSIPCVYASSEKLAWTRDYLCHATWDKTIHQIRIAVRLLLDSASLYQLQSYALPSCLMTCRWTRFCVVTPSPHKLSFFLLFTSADSSCSFIVKF